MPATKCALSRTHAHPVCGCVRWRCTASLRLLGWDAPGPGPLDGLKLAGGGLASICILVLSRARSTQMCSFPSLFYLSSLNRGIPGGWIAGVCSMDREYYRVQEYALYDLLPGHMSTESSWGGFQFYRFLGSERVDSAAAEGTVAVRPPRVR